MAETIMHPVLIRARSAQWIKGSHGYLNLYRCTCGKEFVAQGHDVKNGRHMTCGCAKLCKTTHGMSKHPLYWVHKSMLARCFNQRNSDYKDYGGRGIIVCDQWRNDREAFFEWALSNGWAKGLLIDRIDVNGNYEPANCRFVTSAISSTNKRAHQSKLTPEDVTEMHRMRKRGDKIRDIASRFSVTYYAAWKTLNGINHTRLA